MNKYYFKVDQIINGWMLVPPKEELDSLRKGQSALNVGLLKQLLGTVGAEELYKQIYGTVDSKELDTFQWPIRTHVAQSLDSYYTIAKAYQSFAENYDNYFCLFRGQNRDYFDEDQCLSVLPTAWRSKLRFEYSQFYSETLNNKLIPWLKVIENEISFSAQSHLVINYKEKRDTESVHRQFRNNTPGVRIITNPYLLALAMHYGFPTPTLDVTSDPDVGLWFALNRPQRKNKGKIKYTPVNIGDNSASPSVYIYLQSAHEQNPVIQLTNLKKIKEKAPRALRQRAFALPFWIPNVISAVRGGQTSWIYADILAHRWPSAVIEIQFPEEDLHNARPDFDVDFFFPKNDLFYEKLVELNAPEINIYE